MSDQYDQMDAEELRREVRLAKAQVGTLYGELVSERLGKSRINDNWRRHWQNEVNRANKAEKELSRMTAERDELAAALATATHQEATK